MRFLKSILILILFTLVATTFIFSNDSKVRVTAAKANIRLKPDSQSDIVSKIPLGAVLDVIKKEGEWYFVKLPSDEKGIVVTGYIHQSIVEVIEEIEPPVEPEKKKELVLITPKPVEPVKEISTDADYLRWKDEYFKAERNFMKWKKYNYIGMFSTLGLGLVMPFASVSGVSMGLLMTDLALTLGAGGVWIYSTIKRGSEAEKMELLMNEGRIKKYITGRINPFTNTYAVTLTIAF